jgi:hypothetical protein
VNSTYVCLSSQMCAAPNSTRVPVALPFACCSGQAASSPEFDLPRPPPGKPCRAPTSACSPSQCVLVAPLLGRTEALYAAHCSAEPFPSPYFAPPQPCCPCAAAAARRRPLRPSYHRQSLCGEPNCISPSLVCLSRHSSSQASSPLPSVPREGKARA